MNDLVVGEDGKRRCGWAAGAGDYAEYHDLEWGRPLHGDDALFERISLEAFQAGLSWLIILRKREAFRLAYQGFRIKTVAAFDGTDVERLLADAGIVRSRAKIEASITNARIALALPGGLDSFLWSFAPSRRRRRPRTLAEVPAVTDESKAMATALKRQGFKFLGPSSAYALMQACGMVDDHLAGCHCATPSR